MQKDIRKYTVGFEVVRTEQDKVTVRPYTIVDGDRSYQPDLSLIAGDAYETYYQRHVEFEDTLNVGDRMWKFIRRII